MAKSPPKKKKKVAKKKKSKLPEVDVSASDEDETREIQMSPAKGASPLTRSDPEFLAAPELHPELAPTEPEPGTSTMETATAREVRADSHLGKPYPKPQNIPGPRHPDAPHIEDCRGEYETETHYIYLIKPECYEKMGLKKVIIPKS